MFSDYVLYKLSSRKNFKKVWMLNYARQSVVRSSWIQVVAQNIFLKICSKSDVIKQYLNNLLNISMVKHM